MVRTRQQGPPLTFLPVDVIAKILTLLGASSTIDVLKCKCLCKTLKEAGELDEVYKNMEMDRLSTIRFLGRTNALFGKCREKGNPNLTFRVGMEVFYLKEEARKEMFEEASRLRQRDATFVLGMLLMAEGKERKQEALNLLNDAYRSSGRTWDVLETCTKVERILSRRQKIQIEFRGCYLTCTEHLPDHRRLSRAYLHA